MMKPIQWLGANLGSIAPLTGTDRRAIMAATEVLELYSYTGDDSLLQAYRHIVEQMQLSTRGFAYHLIAMVLDWEDRAVIWKKSGLEPLHRIAICKHEPASSNKGGAA